MNRTPWRDRLLPDGSTLYERAAIELMAAHIVCSATAGMSYGHLAACARVAADVLMAELAEPGKYTREQQRIESEEANNADV